ncbi:MAG: hypothetical protein ACI8WP_000729, partial [Flavobacteriaceae bacterium]
TLFFKVVMIIIVYGLHEVSDWQMTFVELTLQSCGDQQVLVVWQTFTVDCNRLQTVIYLIYK